MTEVNFPALQTFLQGGSFALLAWYFVFGIDRRDARQDKLLNDQRQSFQEELKSLRDAFRDEMLEERKARKEQHERCEETNGRHAEVNAELVDALAAIKTELQRLLDRSDTHRALPPPPTKRQPPQQHPQQ